MPRGKSIVYFIRRHKFKLLLRYTRCKYDAALLDSLSASLSATYTLIDCIIVVSLIAAAGYHYVYYGTPPHSPRGCINMRIFCANFNSCLRFMQSFN